MQPDTTHSRDQTGQEGGGVVRVLFFAALREKIGVREIALDVSGAVSCNELLDQLVEDYPPVAAYRSTLRIAVNKTYVGSTAVIRPGDEVAVITPVSGG